MAITAHAQQVSCNFNIPAQNLSSALQAYAKTSGQQVSFDGSMVRGRTSASLIGSYTADAGIRALLDGTGLTAHRSPRRVLLVESAASQADQTRTR
jgi:iron complex outermembrane receptor protein